MSKLVKSIIVCIVSQLVVGLFNKNIATFKNIGGILPALCVLLYKWPQYSDCVKVA